MNTYFKFNSSRFADDMIKYIETVGWDNFRRTAHTTDKVMLRAIKWEGGTISTHTLAKFCTTMKRSPLLYFELIITQQENGWYE